MVRELRRDGEGGVKARGADAVLIWDLLGVSAGEEGGTTSVAVTCVDVRRNTSGEGGVLDCNCRGGS